MYNERVKFSFIIKQFYVPFLCLRHESRHIEYAHFLTNNLNGPPIKYLGLINYLINQPNKPSPLKYPKQLPTIYLGLFLKCFDTILEAHNPKHTTQSTRTPYTAPKKNIWAYF